MSDIERVKKIIDWLIFIGVASSRKNLAEKLEYKDTYLSQIENGKVRISPKFIKNLSNLDNRINERWLTSGIGEMLLESDIMVQNNSGGNNQQGHQNQQVINSEKLFKDFLTSLKGQNELTKQAMAQTSLVIESVRASIAEMAEQRKQMDRLITMIENLQSK